jgi:hypothetical protein
MRRNNLALQKIAAIHFVLTINALFTHETLRAYEFYNILFFVTLFWSIHSKESTEPVNLVSNSIMLLATDTENYYQAYAIDFAALFFDVFVCFVYTINNWAVLFVILNMLFRIYSMKEIYEEIVARGGDAENPGVV